MVWPEVGGCATTHREQKQEVWDLLSCTLAKWILFFQRVSGFSDQAPTAWDFLLAPCKFPSVRVPLPNRSLVSHNQTLYDYIDVRVCIYIYIHTCVPILVSQSCIKGSFPLMLISPCWSLTSIFEFLTILSILCWWPHLFLTFDSSLLWRSNSLNMGTPDSSVALARS